MRISTQQFNSRSIAGILDQQSALSTTQSQVATGKKVSTPADDPIATVQIAQLQRAQSELDQFGKNSDLARTRLTLEEQALSDAGTVLDRIRELTVQASNTGGLTATDQQSIANEIAQREQELLDIANRKDGNGEYLFSGLSTTTQPFVRASGGGVSYAGSPVNRLVQIGQSQRVADSDPGFDVFVTIPEGNGTFATSASAANTGAGVISAGSVINKAAWIPDNYTLTFTSATTWQVTDSASNTIATGNYTDGGAIAFNGVQVAVTGAPASGDTFSIAQAGKQDIFATLDNLVSALRQPSGSGQLSTALGGALQQIDQANTQFTSVRTQVGARLSTLDDADASRQDQSVQYQSAVSTLQDIDLATAITKLNQQAVGLQAAQQAYTKIAQLSLFNYL